MFILSRKSLLKNDLLFLNQYLINRRKNFELKYYFFIFKNRSMSESSLSNYYFAVTPFSLQFDRQHKTRFHFFFQKNPQIISKYQSPVSQVKKNETVLFAPPQQIQTFRIPNQKSMDYEWSLYIFRVDIEKDNEELIQKQKISLKDEWKGFKQKGFKQSGGSVYQCNIKFNSIRCKLSYLVVIGGNNKELLDNTQKYFDQSKISVITTDQKITKQEFQLQKPAVSKSQDTYSNPKNTKVSKQSKKQRAPIEQQIKISEVLHRGRYSFESQMSLIDSKNMGEQFINMKQEQFVKLSNSQLEICQQIESKILQIEPKPNLQRILQPESPVSEKPIEIQQPPVKKLLQPEQKNIRMTCSQLLNQKKEDISSSRLPKNYIVLFISIVIAIVAGGLWLVAKSGPKVVQKAKSRRSKNPKKEAKQAPAKKTRSKQ